MCPMSYRVHSLDYFNDYFLENRGDGSKEKG